MTLMAHLRDLDPEHGLLHTGLTISGPSARLTYKYMMDSSAIQRFRSEGSCSTTIYQIFSINSQCGFNSTMTTSLDSTTRPHSLSILQTELLTHHKLDGEHTGSLTLHGPCHMLQVTTTEFTGVMEDLTSLKCKWI